MKTTRIKKLLAFTLLMVFSLSLVHGQSYPAEFNNGQTINPLIGDVSFVTKFGYQPDATTNEDLRIQTHLAYVENLLRQKDVSNLTPELQQKRSHVLDLLHQYWSAGKFPRNYDYKDVRKSCFIDKDKTICAVGYLVEKTAGRNVAEAINSNHKYDFIYEMNDALVDSWIANSGLTKDECAMIQPDYGGDCGWVPCCPNNKVYACRTSYCVTECKCVNASQVDQWQSNGHPCDTTGHGHNGHHNGRVSAEENIVHALDIYPNPASTSAVISFYLDQPQKISIKLLDMTGKLVTVITDDAFQEGDNEFNWNINNISNGIYLIRIESGDFSETQKISLIK